MGDSSGDVGTPPRLTLGRTSTLMRRSNLSRRSRPASSGPPEPLPKLRVGVCALDKKAQSKPMKEIIGRMVMYGDLDVINFGDDAIHNKPVEEWPVVEALLCWHSDGFPLAKAQAYVRLRQVYMVNDVHMQVRHRLTHRCSAAVVEMMRNLCQWCIQTVINRHCCRSSARVGVV